MGDNKAKVLLLDIETAPILAYVWGAYDQNIIQVHTHWYILSFSYKWVGEEDIVVRALPDYKGYNRNKTNDKKLVTDLWKLLNEADVVVAHNGDAFDVKKSNVRFIANGLPPPTPYQTVDTLKLAKRHFRFDQNNLNALGQIFELGKKQKTDFSLWKGCMDGDPSAWKRMKSYNANDIVLLEQIYLKFRPWAKSHPNLNLLTRRPDAESCPHCLSSNVQRRGFSYAKVRIRQRYRCNDCGAWYSGAIVKKEST